MGERLKLVYIGAGSHRFSIGLFRNIVNAKELYPMDVVLLDVHADIVQWTTKLLQSMAKKVNADITVTGTTNQRQALTNADFVYKSISIGGQKAEWFDNYIPIKFGIPQNTGDTCGPGGFFRALRCCYAVDSIARDMKDVCPKAVLLNYTNPQAQIVHAARNVMPDLQYVGLCHELFGGMSSIQKLMNHLGHKTENWNEFHTKYAGVNHFTWLTGLELNGEDLYPTLLENAEMAYKSNKFDRSYNYYLTMKYDCFPYPGSEHVAEFMCEYFNHFNHKPNPFGITTLRDVYHLAESHKWKIQSFKVMGTDLYENYVPSPTGHGEHAMEMTSDWKNNTPNQHVVNIPNKGYVDNLPEGAVVEVPGYFKDGKMVGKKVGKLPDAVADRVRPFTEIYQIAAKAAITGDRDSIVKAFTTLCPMTTFIEDDKKILDMIDLMLYYQQQWLPAFNENGVIPTLDKIKSQKYYVSPADLTPFSKASEKMWLPNDNLIKKAVIVEKGQTPQDIGDVL